MSLAGYCGFLNLHKPAGISSAGVVNRVRRALPSPRSESSKGIRVGHCGTLDPAATGVLVLCLGSATRLASLVSDCPKTYLATVLFGKATSTLDSEGEITQVKPCPNLSLKDVASVIPNFIGSIELIPPAISALHYQGERLYDLARRGIEVPRKPRLSQIFSLRLILFKPGEFPTLTIEVVCSAGTYIRSLAEALGESLGCPAYLARLARLAVGSFRIEHSCSLPTAIALAEAGRLSEAITQPQRLPLSLPRFEIDAKGAERLSRGQPAIVSLTVASQGTSAVLDSNALNREQALVRGNAGESINGRKDWLVYNPDNSWVFICSGQVRGQDLLLQPIKVIRCNDDDI